MIAKLTGQISGNFTAFNDDQWQEDGRVVLNREHPDWTGENGDVPLFEVTTHGEKGIPLRGGGHVRVIVRQHGDRDYRVTVWKANRIVWQTIPCDDLRVVCYLANCTTLLFRVNQQR